MDRERASLRFHDCTHLMYAHTVRAARTVVWHAMSVGTHLLLLLLLLLAFQHPPSLPRPRGAAPVDVYGSDKPAIVLGVVAALLIAQLTYAQVGMCTLMTDQIDDMA